MAKAEDGGGEKDGMSLPAKVAVASALGLGALVTGYLATRQGRRLVGDTFKGVRRSPLEYDVLEELDERPRLARRHITVKDEGGGRVALEGRVASEAERRVARRTAGAVKGVTEVIDRLEVGPAGPERAG